MINNQVGFTFLEMLIALLVSSVIFLILASTLAVVSRTLHAQDNKIQVLQELLVTSIRLRKDGLCPISGRSWAQYSAHILTIKCYGRKPVTYSWRKGNLFRNGLKIISLPNRVSLKIISPRYRASGKLLFALTVNGYENLSYRFVIHNATLRS